MKPFSLGLKICIMPTKLPSLVLDSVKQHSSSCWVVSAEKVGDVAVITFQPENVDKDVLRDYADRLRTKQKAAVLLAAEIDGKVALLAAVSKDLVKQGVNASDCVKAAAKLVKGGGGGRPDLAEAGGKDPSKISEALKAGAEFYRSKLG